MVVSHKGTQTLVGVKKKLALAAFAIIYISVEGAAACSQLTGSLSLFINFNRNNEKSDCKELLVRQLNLLMELLLACQVQRSVPALILPAAGKFVSISRVMELSLVRGELPDSVPEM